MVGRTARPAPNVATWMVDSLVEFDDARTLMVLRDRRKRDTERTAHDRASHFLTHHIKQGTLALASGSPRRIRAGQLVRLLRSKFPGIYDDLPQDEADHTATLGETGNACDQPDATLLPGNVTRCHKEIERLIDRVVALESELRAANQRIVQLEPFAEKWRERLAMLKRAANQKRGPRQS